MSPAYVMAITSLASDRVNLVNPFQYRHAEEGSGDLGNSWNAIIG